MKPPKILLLGRHGDAPKGLEGASLDQLIPETVTYIYEYVGKPLYEKFQEKGITPKRTFLKHSDKIRTRDTGLAVLVGAFNIQPRTGENPPTCQEDLQNYDFSDIDISKHDGLCYRKHWVNLTVMRRTGRYDANINYWLANPDANDHEGEPITPYNEVYPGCRTAVKDAVRRLISGDKDLGILASHTSVIEPAIFALIDSARSTPVTKIEEIGGGFKKAEFAQLVVEQSPGGVYTARLELRDQDYKVDLERL